MTIVYLAIAVAAIAGILYGACAAIFERSHWFHPIVIFITLIGVIFVNLF